MGAFTGQTLLQVTPQLNEGGVERATLEMSRAFTEAGGRSLVVSEGGRMDTELARHGGELIHMRVASKNPATILANAARIARLIRAEKVDLVHARSRASAWSAFWAARSVGARFVTTYHGIYSGRSRLKRLYNSVMARGEVVIANSDFTRAHVLATHAVDPDRVVTIDRGVDLAAFAEPSEARLQRMAEQWGPLDGDVFLLPGRLTPWKGQALAMEAIARVQRPCTLVLAGEGKRGFEAELRASAPAHVKLVGHVSDMAAAYTLADFVLVPSLDPEAFGRTAIEPQAMRRPVLAARHGAPADTVLDRVTGWLVEPRSVEAWARAITHACDTPKAVRAQMGAAGRRRVEEFYSIERMCRRTLAVYAGLLRRGAPEA